MDANTATGASPMSVAKACLAAFCAREPECHPAAGLSVRAAIALRDVMPETLRAYLWRRADKDAAAARAAAQRAAAALDTQTQSQRLQAQASQAPQTQ